jgi:chromate transporter
MVLPGPEAQQLATYIGWLMHRTWGGVIAGFLFVLPSVFILIALSWIYMAYGALPAVAGVLYGIKPAVTAIVAFAAYRIGSRALRNAVLIGMAAAAFIAILVFSVPFPLIIVAAALLGYAGSRVAPDKFRIGGHGAAGKSYGPAIIDDDTPTPEHARFSWPRLVRIAVACIGLWLAAMSMLAAWFGWQGSLTQMGWFFSKAAVLTFGGAYAVLPYVYQGAVIDFHWITAAQMIDGLALGETTPGPLIMVVAFVGFVGAWTAQLFGSEGLLLAGIAGACVATFFTFLPSFLFILVGGPLVESTHGDIQFTAPLTGITAAVVGVILNLSVFFAYHVLWPVGFAGPFDGVSAAIGLAAAMALFRFKIGVIPVIGGCALLGLIARMIAT